MKTMNPIFEQNYHDYLNQLKFSDAWLRRSSELGGVVINEGQTVQLPFLNKMYQVSTSGITDPQGNRPDYSICVILLKYLLMNPSYAIENREWIPFREFKDAGRGQNTGLSDYSLKKISDLFSNRLSSLKHAVDCIGATTPEEEYPYDLCVVIEALPRVPLLLLFNDKDKHLPAQTLILYERRAAYFLDAECRIMIEWRLFQHLKRAGSFSTASGPQ